MKVQKGRFFVLGLFTRPISEADFALDLCICFNKNIFVLLLEGIN